MVSRTDVSALRPGPRLQHGIVDHGDVWRPMSPSGCRISAAGAGSRCGREGIHGLEVGNDRSDDDAISHRRRCGEGRGRQGGGGSGGGAGGRRRRGGPGAGAGRRGQAKEQVHDLVDRGRRDLGAEAATRSRQMAGSVRTLADQVGALAAGDPQAAGPLTDLLQEGRDRLQSFAGRLDDGPNAVLDDVRRFARRQPLLFLATAGAIGFVAGRLVRADARPRRSGRRRAGRWRRRRSRRRPRCRRRRRRSSRRSRSRGPRRVSTCPAERCCRE